MNATLVTEKPDDNVEPLVHNRPRAAKKVGLSVSRLDILHRQGLGPRAVILGRRRVYLEDDLMEWLRAKRAA